MTAPVGDGSGSGGGFDPVGAVVRTVRDIRDEAIQIRDKFNAFIAALDDVLSTVRGSAATEDPGGDTIPRRAEDGARDGGTA